jgi:hypothetical protein
MNCRIHAEFQNNIRRGGSCVGLNPLAILVVWHKITRLSLLLICNFNSHQKKKTYWVSVILAIVDWFWYLEKKKLTSVLQHISSWESLPLHGHA